MARPRWWSGSLRKPNAQELFLLLALFFSTIRISGSERTLSVGQSGSESAWRLVEKDPDCQSTDVSPKSACILDKGGLGRWKHRSVSLNLSAAQDKIEDGGSQVRSTIGLGALFPRLHRGVKSNKFGAAIDFVQIT